MSNKHMAESIWAWATTSNTRESSLVLGGGGVYGSIFCQKPTSPETLQKSIQNRPEEGVAYLWVDWMKVAFYFAFVFIAFVFLPRFANPAESTNIGLLSNNATKT